MKKIFTILLITLSSVSTFSQLTTDTVSLKMSKKDSVAFLMEKSDEQKTGAFILGGIGLVSAGFAYAKIFSLTSESTSGPIVALSIVSFSACLGSAALILASKKTKARAQSLIQESDQNILGGSYHQTIIKNQEKKTMIIAGSIFKHSSIKSLRNASLGISNDQINMGYYSRPAKLNSLVLSVSLGR